MEIINTKLRIPAELKRLIEARASAHRRSMNSEILVLLEAAVAAEGAPTAEQASRA